MFKCLSCGAVFSDCGVIYEQSGERWHICPFCRDRNFFELRSASDAFLLTEKALIIEYTVSALAYLNKGDTLFTKQILTELIAELLAQTPFEYEQSLSSVIPNNKDRLISQLCTALEVKWN